MTAASEITESTGHATTIFGAMTSGVDLTLPIVDVSSTAYAPPTTVGNPLYTAPVALTTEDLTTGALDGAGTFDKIMASLNVHFEKQYNEGRITGGDYANAYVAATQGALGAAVQFVLGRDQAFWQAQLAQMQARVAEAEAIRAALAIEETRAAVINARSNALLSQAQYALAKYQLTTEAVQIERIEAEIAKVSYETTNLLPVEVSRVTAAKDQVLYQTANILPSQNAGLTKDNAIKDYQLASLYPAQVGQITTETAMKEYQKDFIMVEQYALAKEQVEAARAQTLDTRRDLSTVSGTIGVQKALQNEQIISYKRDAETKYVKLGIDSWMLQKSTDEGIEPPVGLNNVNLDALLTSLKTNLGL